MDQTLHLAQYLQAFATTFGRIFVFSDPRLHSQKLHIIPAYNIDHMLLLSPNSWVVSTRIAAIS
jgi:hypothetical protein